MYSVPNVVATCLQTAGMAKVKLECCTAGSYRKSTHWVCNQGVLGPCLLHALLTLIRLLTTQ